jgi:hypothetical protein
MYMQGEHHKQRSLESKEARKKDRKRYTKNGKKERKKENNVETCNNVNNCPRYETISSPLHRSFYALPNLRIIV